MHIDKWVKAFVAVVHPISYFENTSVLRESMRVGLYITFERS